MRLYLLLNSTGIVWFILSISYCLAQEYNFRSEPNCGKNLKDVRSNRNDRRRAEALIASWNRESIEQNMGPGTISKNEAVRIDLQKIINRDGKHWANLQVQINEPRPKGKSTSIAGVMLETDRRFPVRYIRRAFVRSMNECAFIWLSQIETTKGITTTTPRGRTTTTPRGRTTTTKRGLITRIPTTKKSKKLN